MIALVFHETKAKIVLNLCQPFTLACGDHIHKGTPTGEGVASLVNTPFIMHIKLMLMRNPEFTVP